jgi:predicted O-linked N-acetylglucosamine transferase (SPINDLY family)
VKLDPETWEVWTQILRKVPLAVLWLLRFEPLAERNLRARAQASGVDPSRLIFTQVIHEA